MALNEHVNRSFLGVKETKKEENLENASPMERLILTSPHSDIGNCVLEGRLISRDLATAATAICRRRFKAKDIVLMVLLDENEEGESGIVFTETGIYHWLEDEEFMGEILYMDIESVDYDEENVMITDGAGRTVEIFCGEDDDEEHYSRYMYNFIMDIKEGMEEIE